jgi:hypothetical protein
MQLSYQNAYLAKFCNDERESRAFEDVDALGTFATDWRNRLATVRCYIIACLENQAQPDDLFADKLKHYRSEYGTLTTQAKAATVDTVTGLGSPVFSIPLERA